MTYYALIQDGAIQRINITLPTVVGNTSIPKGASGLEAFGLYPITGNEPAYNPATQRLTGPTYQFTGTEVQRVYTVEDIPAEELALKVKAEIVDATQKRLDDFARTRNYDDTDSISKYKDISDAEIAALPTDEQPLVTKFRAECRYLAVTTARTWAKLYLILAEVQEGTRPMPGGFADIEGELPVLAWPL